VGCCGRGPRCVIELMICEMGGVTCEQMWRRCGRCSEADAKWQVQPASPTSRHSSHNTSRTHVRLHRAGVFGLIEQLYSLYIKSSARYYINRLPQQSTGLRSADLYSTSHGAWRAGFRQTFGGLSLGFSCFLGEEWMW
jgi:hypothetical protein